MPATVKHIDLPAHRRAFAVSDVHGNLDYLKGLLDKISFSTDDILILLGDLVEKGPDSIGTLRYVMELCSTHTVYVLQGNCDRLLFDPDISSQWLYRYRNSWGGHHMMNEFARLLGLPVSCEQDVDILRQRVRQEFPEMAAFLSGLPTVLESEHYVFVHGGLPGEDCLRDPSRLNHWECMKNDDFVNQGHVFREKWCVVGHWPVTLYRENCICANPFITPAQQIVSIDGGCVIKRDGQLNALHLPPVPAAGRFEWTYYDALPTATALDAQAASEHSINIPYGNNKLEILERGDEFCRCLHLATGKPIYILTQDIWETDHGVFCEDSTDYLMPVQPGDILSVVQKTSRGWLVKKDGVSGWYHGSLLWRDGACEKP